MGKISTIIQSKLNFVELKITGAYNNRYMAICQNSSIKYLRSVKIYPCQNFVLYGIGVDSRKGMGGGEP